MGFGWGFAVFVAGILLMGLVFVVAGVQMARGRWRHVLAGASALSKRERGSAATGRAVRATGVLLVLLGLGVAGIGGWQAWLSYAPGNDGMLAFAGAIIVLVDLFVVWALHAAREESEREDSR